MYSMLRKFYQYLHKIINERYSEFGYGNSSNKNNK